MLTLTHIYIMKAHLITALFAVAAPLSMADISLGTQTPAPAQTAKPSAEEYAQLAKDILNTLKELAGSLASVTDQASADTAAAQVADILPRMVELQKKAEGMPRPCNEIEAIVRGQVNVEEAQQVVSSFMSAFINICMHNAYGSQNLLNALGPVMNIMPESRQ